MPATEKQISYLIRLARDAGFSSVPAAVEAYGLRHRYADELSVHEASEVIDALKSGLAPSVPQIEAFADGTRVRHADADGELIASLNDGRCIVKMDDGRREIVAASELFAI